MWLLTLGIVLFVLSSLLIRGNALNECIPDGIVGFIFWAIVMLLVLHFLISPLVVFIGLPQWKSREEQMDPISRMKFLEKYAKRILKTQAHASAGSSVLAEKLEGVDRALKEMDASCRLTLLEKNISELRDTLRTDICSSVISAHMKYAALAVVVSQRGILDSFIVFAIQIKLIIALSRTLGHRPSWAFVSCCMVWVVSNSLVSLIFDETNITETVFSSLGDVLGIRDVTRGLLGEIPGLKTVANLSIQGITAASSVYITGELVCSRLLGNSQKRTMKELLKMRVDGYKEAVKVAGSIATQFFFGAKSSKDENCEINVSSSDGTPL